MTRIAELFPQATEISLSTDLFKILLPEKSLFSPQWPQKIAKLARKYEFNMEKCRISTGRLPRNSMNFVCKGEEPRDLTEEEEERIIEELEETVMDGGVEMLEVYPNSKTKNSKNSAHFEPKIMKNHLKITKLQIFWNISTSFVSKFRKFTFLKPEKQEMGLTTKTVSGYCSKNWKSVFLSFWPILLVFEMKQFRNDKNMEILVFYKKIAEKSCFFH